MTTVGDPNREYGSRPPPDIDPTKLTTDALMREVTAIEKLLQTKIDAVINQIDLMGKLRDEKLVTVQTQFDLIERQRVENKADTKAAVDAALQAAKEAVKEQTTASDRAISKSETSTAEQLKQMNITFSTAISAINQPISDIKDRLTTLESIRVGGDRNQASMYALFGLVATIVVLVLSAIGLLAR